MLIFVVKIFQSIDFLGNITY